MTVIQSIEKLSDIHLENPSLSAVVALTRFRSSVSPACFPPTVLLLDVSLPSTGSFRASSPASSVLSTRYDFLPPVSPHFVAFAWRYHGNTRDFAPHAAECCGVGPGVYNPVSPAGVSSMETTGSPTFLGNLWCLCPALRPRQDQRVRPLRHANAAPALTTTKAPALQLSRLNHTASALAAGTVRSMVGFAGRVTPPPRKTRFRLPAKLYRTGFPPAGFLQKVSNSRHVCYPPLPSFRGARSGFNY